MLKVYNQQCVKALSITSGKCLFSTDSSRRSKLTDYKRGRGGRSSFSGVVATVFGGTGALGLKVINQLGKIGSQVIVPYRGDPYSIREIKLMGDLGQILFLPYHIEDEESIRNAVKHSNVVINCTGKFNETKNFSFKKIHVDAPARIARISREMGVKKLIHVSALNCSEEPHPYLLPKGSEFLRTKALGEIAVRNEFPEAVIIRPSYMWGQYDSFLFYYLRNFRHHRFFSHVVVPLWKQGKFTVKQPVYGRDVALAIANASQDPECHSAVYQAVGPNRYYLHDVVKWMFQNIRVKPKDLHIVGMNPFMKQRVAFNSWIQPINPPVSKERLEFECHTDLVDSNLLSLIDLGVEQLTKLEDTINWEVRTFRRYTFHTETLGEFPLPPNPPLATC